MNRADVVVVEPNGGLRLTSEALFELLVLKDPVTQELQGNVSFEPRVLGRVHDTHAAPAELLQDLVMADRLANQDGRF